MSKSFFSGKDDDGMTSEAARQAKNFWNKAKDKCAEFMDDVKNDPKLEGVVNLAQTHRKETFFIALMGIGILISFFHFLGGLLVGAISTICLPWDLAFVWKKISEFYDRRGQFKTVILGLAGLFLLLHVPSLIIGAALGLALNLFLKSEAVRPAKEGLKESAKEISDQMRGKK